MHKWRMMKDMTLEDLIEALSVLAKDRTKVMNGTKEWKDLTDGEIDVVTVQQLGSEADADEQVEFARAVLKVFKEKNT